MWRSISLTLLLGSRAASQEITPGDNRGYILAHSTEIREANLRIDALVIELAEERNRHRRETDKLKLNLESQLAKLRARVAALEEQQRSLLATS